MAGWLMTRLTSMSNMGWLYNCIIWFYSFYWLWPSSLILPALRHEVMHVHTLKEERMDEQMRTCHRWQYATAHGEADMAT